MEKFTERITSMLREKLSLYQELRSLLGTEEKYIIEMDVAGLWAVTEQKKELAATLEKIIEEILELFKLQLLQTDIDTQSFQMSKVLGDLPISLEIKSELQKIVLAINACKEEISLLAIKNKRYVTEYLSVIDDIFSTVVNSTGKKQYSHSGHIIAGKDKHHLINAEV
ncbi:MAG: flagellar export chaperone FlgN [Desulfobacula sp.]|jgi:flagellar biosynthesis/type III secretory pathway chaperone|nr:flagellar export chaperone FlgN [Desulfobacula sp.]